jgi:hypothetical protein
MKYLKILGLVAIAAVALTALVGVGSVGVGSASAATLCENNQATGCTSHVNSGGTITFSAEDSIKLAGPFGIILNTCTESTIQGKAGNTGADDETTAVAYNVTSWTFNKCTRPTTVGAGGTLSVTASGTAGNGSVTSTGTTVSVHELPNIVGNPSTCAYITSNTPIWTITSSATAATTDISATLTSETPHCPSFTWSGHYVSTGTVLRAIAH